MFSVFFTEWYLLYVTQTPFLLLYVTQTVSSIEILCVPCLSFILFYLSSSPTFQGHFECKAFPLRCELLRLNLILKCPPNSLYFAKSQFLYWILWVQNFFFFPCPLLTRKVFALLLWLNCRKFHSIKWKLATAGFS
jgi:hypothetical protein